MCFMRRNGRRARGGPGEAVEGGTPGPPNVFSPGRALFDEKGDFCHPMTDNNFVDAFLLLVSRASGQHYNRTSLQRSINKASLSYATGAFASARIATCMHYTGCAPSLIAPPPLFSGADLACTVHIMAVQLQRKLLCTCGTTRGAGIRDDVAPGQGFRITHKDGCNVTITICFGDVDGQPCIAVDFPDDALVGHPLHVRDRFSSGPGAENVVNADQLRIATMMVWSSVRWHSMCVFRIRSSPSRSVCLCCG
jgi:hypothetical protein